MRIIKLMIVDDHPSVLSGLQQMLGSFPQLQIIGVYQSGAALMDGVIANPPDIILMDIQMPGMDGFQLCKQIKALFSTVKIIALTGCEEKYQLKAMLQNGASGYLLKTADKEVIMEAIEAVLQGQQYIHGELKDLLVQDLLAGKAINKHTPSLSKREKEILQLIATGSSNQEIANTLFLSIRTVENHRFNIMQKLEVKNAAGLIQVALQRGLIS